MLKKICIKIVVIQYGLPLHVIKQTVSLKHNCLFHLMHTISVNGMFFFTVQLQLKRKSLRLPNSWILIHGSITGSCKFPGVSMSSSMLPVILLRGTWCSGYHQSWRMLVPSWPWPRSTTAVQPGSSYGAPTLLPSGHSRNAAGSCSAFQCSVPCFLDSLLHSKGSVLLGSNLEFILSFI